VARNGGRDHYRAAAADHQAYRRARRPKSGKLAVEAWLRAVVEDKLGRRWSPQQIAGWLSVAYPDEAAMRVSHETIYLSLFVQARGALRRDLGKCLQTGRVMRYPRGARLPQGRGQLVDMVPISERPAGAADRGRYPGTGKATCCWAVGRRRLPPWWNGPAATCNSSRFLPDTKPNSSAPRSLPRSPGCPHSYAAY
jgi:IS30 family transposase